MKAAVMGGGLPQEGIREYCRCGEGHAEDESTSTSSSKPKGASSTTVSAAFCQRCMSPRSGSTPWAATRSPSSLRDGVSSIDCSGVREAADNADVARLDVYADDFCHDQSETMGSGLFLSYIGKGRSFSGDSALDAFKRAFAWFDAGIETIGVNQRASSTEYYTESSTLDQVAEVLSSFDTGISGLCKEEVGMDELDKIVPPEIRFTITELLRANAPKRDSDKFGLTFATRTSSWESSAKGPVSLKPRF